MLAFGWAVFVPGGNGGNGKVGGSGGGDLATYHGGLGGIRSPRAQTQPTAISGQNATTPRAADGGMYSITVVTSWNPKAAAPRKTKHPEPFTWDVIVVVYPYVPDAGRSLLISPSSVFTVTMLSVEAVKFDCLAQSKHISLVGGCFPDGHVSPGPTNSCPAGIGARLGSGGSGGGGENSVDVDNARRGLSKQSIVSTHGMYRFECSMYTLTISITRLARILELYMPSSSSILFAIVFKVGNSPM